MTIASSGFVPAPTPALATTSAGQIVQTAARMAGGDPSAIGSYAEDAIKAHALRILALAQDLDGLRAQLGDTWSAGAMAVSTGGALVSGVGQLSTHSDHAVQATGAITKGAETLSAIQTGYQMVTSVAEPIVAALLSNPYTAASGYAYGQTTSSAVSTVTDLLGSLISKIASTALNAFVTSMVEQGVQSLMADDPPQTTYPQVTGGPAPVSYPASYPGSYPGASYPASYPAPNSTAYPGAYPTAYPTAYPASSPGAGDLGSPGFGSTPAGYQPPPGFSSVPTAAPYTVPGLTTASGLPLDPASYDGGPRPLTGSAGPWTTAASLPPWLDAQGGSGDGGPGNGNGNGNGGGNGHDGGSGQGNGQGNRHDGGHGQGNGHGNGHGNGDGRHDQGGGHHGGRQPHHDHDGFHEGGHGHGPGRDDGGTEITIAAADEQVTIHVDGDDPTTIHTHLGGLGGNDFEITVDPDRR